MEPNANEHGGDLAIIRAQYPAVEDWIDLSTGINPYAYRPTVALDVSMRALPDRAMMGALIDAAAMYYRVPPASLLAAAGTQAIIQWLPLWMMHIYGVRNVGVVSPTYNEHASAWARAGHSVQPVTGLTEAVDVLVVTNPNNPDGRLYSRETLLATAQALAAKGGWMVVDEAYVDVEPAQSVCTALAHCHQLIVMRSFGKFFGLAGLRLGFAAASPRVVRELSTWLGPWPVSGPAACIATQAYRDTAWSTAMRDGLQKAAEQRDALLHSHGVVLRGSHALFCLAEIPRARALFTAMAEVGLFARMFADNPNWLRIGALTPEACLRLTQALGVWAAQDVS